MLLGDLGASVTVVDEGTDPGNRGRRSLAESSTADLTEPLEYMRRNAQRIALDLRHPDAQVVIQRLVSQADVLIESFRPGVAARLGLGYDELSERHQRLVYCSISGYGQSGPYRDRQGHDINYLALGGLLALTGSADGPPSLPGTLVADLAGGGLPATVSILGALLARERTGQGQYIDVSLQEGVVGLLSPMIALQLAGWHVGRGNSVLSGAAPWYRVYPTCDGRYVAVGAIEPWLFATLCQLLEHPEWHARQYDEAGWPEMATEMERIFAAQPLQHWRDLLEPAGVCVTAVSTLDEVYNDPQLADRGAFGSGAIQAANVRALPIMSGMPERDVQPPSAPGADADAVLAALGFGSEERQRLRTNGGVG
jgi:crotonobetainyl-CoA:carnitine CoA-transferase CaiB-like acyl-CoA transferase